MRSNLHVLADILDQMSGDAVIDGRKYDIIAVVDAGENKIVVLTKFQNGANHKGDAEIPAGMTPAEGLSIASRLVYDAARWDATHH